MSRILELIALIATVAILWTVYSLPCVNYP